MWDLARPGAACGKGFALGIAAGITLTPAVLVVPDGPGLWAWCVPLLTVVVARVRTAHGRSVSRSPAARRRP
ncbi:MULTISPECIES: hypothetical protein [Streptomyces]|uniref:hypothetical protein n=1 Tax=Streptomyces TaxID=1883 RepID=UPI00099E6F8D|nr:hypothetical protein [Streptomyces sp. IMTB 1903]